MTDDESRNVAFNRGFNFYSQENPYQKDTEQHIAFELGQGARRHHNHLVQLEAIKRNPYNQFGLFDR